MKNIAFAIVAIVAALAGGLAWSVYSLQASNDRLEEQLAAARGYQQQLQEQAEASARQRLQFEARLDALQGQLLESTTRLSSLSAALQEAREQINPDYDALLEQARREVAAQQPQPARVGPMAVFGGEGMRAVAENSVDNDYGEFLDSLGLDAAARAALRDAMVEHGSRRLELLRQLMSGELDAAEAALYFGPDGLGDYLADQLDSRQTAALLDYQVEANRETSRQMYERMFDMNGDAISGLTRDLVLDVLLEEIYSPQNNFGAMVAADGSLETARQDRRAAFDRARSRLEGELSSEQLAQLDRFTEQQGNGINFVMSVGDGDGSAGTVHALRIGSDIGPN